MRDDATGTSDEPREAAGVDELETLRERNRQLQEALDSRVDIEQAKGVLAERLGVSTDAAFTLLRYAARTARMSIHELALETRPGHRTPGAVLIAMSRTERWRAAAQRERAEAHRERSADQRRRMQEAYQPPPYPQPPGDPKAG